MLIGAAAPHQQHTEAATPAAAVPEVAAAEQAQAAVSQPMMMPHHPMMPGTHTQNPLCAGRPWAFIGGHITLEWGSGYMLVQHNPHNAFSLAGVGLNSLFPKKMDQAT